VPACGAQAGTPKSGDRYNIGIMDSRIDYDAWAKTYDETRGASPSVLCSLLAALGPSAGHSLLDIGGGTGNFAKALAEEGFRVSLCDYSPEMVRRASAKLSDAPVCVADAAHLPFRDASFDCAISVNVLGHVEDWRSMLAEARWITRGGPYVMKASTRETLEANWVVEYLPGIRDHAPVHHYQRESVITAALREANFSRVELSRVHYTEMVDRSIQALKHFPEVFLDDERILNTATLKRLPDPERETGLKALRRDYASCRLREVIARYERLIREYGDGSVFAAWA
jgi:ubiquinone/menaquinone biosynthesis C-methylase UbiE